MSKWTLQEIEKEVSRVVRGVLEDLEDDYEIKPDSKLVEDLGANSVTNLLDIFYGLGFRLRDCSSGGRITSKRKQSLYQIADRLQFSKKQSNHFKELGDCNTSKELLNKLEYNDLVIMRKYE